MSEYQYYEFLAIDRPLSKKEMAELRAISTRAEITPTSFVNTYEWGDLKARPIEMVKKYFDAFVYLANWGTRECMFRLPLEKVDPKALAPHLKGDAGTLAKTPSFAIFSFGTDGEGAEEEAAMETGEGMMASLLPLRESLLAGDLRPLYLRWLQRVQAEEVEEHVVEPPVPAGLGKLSGALSAFIDLLQLDAALVEVAAEGAEPAENDDDVQRWLQRLAPERKDAWLARMVRDAGARADLLREYRKAGHRPDAGRRTVEALLYAAETRRETRKKEAAEQWQRERDRFEAEQAAEREKHLKRLAADETRPWARVDGMIAAKPAQYGEAVRLQNTSSDGRTQGTNFAGLRVELPAGTLRFRLNQEGGFLATEPTVLNLFSNLSRRETGDIVLEPDRIRFLPREEALTFWREWAEGENK